MSIAFEMSNTSDYRIKRPGFVNGMTCFPIYKSPEFGSGDCWVPSKQEEDDEDDRNSTSSSSSSIGRNSDESPAERSSLDGGEGEEVQSSLKAGAVDNLEALEEVLPMKRGISTFYGGKSKSFTSLADAASCSSLEEIVKQENAYTRKRKNLLAHNNFFDKNYSHFPRSKSGGIYKRPAKARSSLALATGGSCNESNSSSESLNSSPPSTLFSLPPLPQGPQPSRRYVYGSSLSPAEQKFNAWRSFSLSDLQRATAATPNLTLTGIKE